MTVRHFYDDYAFMAVRRRDVKEGDLYANHGTITEVVVGPADLGDKWMSPKRGEVLIRCGPDFSSKAKSGDRIVIGRSKLTR